MKIFHILAFALIYLREVVMSTFRLAQMVLRPQIKLDSRFVEVPLDLQGEMPRFLFACLISMTPGSMSVGIDPDRGVLVVHLLDAPDPESAIREMKAVFEQPLIRIFGRG
ncbi:MAG: Na+/H+ antiporter subunit E [Akkermansiaceae bacterium]|jgi:multicomponent K+:H+ antiporter subunit E